MQKINKSNIQLIFGGSSCQAQMCDMILEITQTDSPKELFISNKNKYLAFSNGPCANFRLSKTYAESDSRTVTKELSFNFYNLTNDEILSVPDFILKNEIIELKESYSLHCEG